MQSKITHIEPRGTHDNGTRTFQKYQVSFANGDSLSFLAVGQFKFNVNDVIHYNKNEMQQTGQVDYENTKPKNTQNSTNTFQGKKPDSVQISIIRQSSLNRATDLYSKGGNWDEQTIIETARIFENYVHNG